MHRALPVLLALAAGLWAFMASKPHPAGAPEALAPLTDRWDLGWARGPWESRATDEPPRRMLVYVRADNAPCLALERAAGADEGVARAAASFEAILLEPEARGEDARLAEALGVHTTPRLLVLEPASWRQLVRGTAIAADLPIRPVRAITGGHLEPIGVAWELELAATESPASWPQARSPAPGADPVLATEWLEAAGALAEAEALLSEGLASESSPNGIFHRMARLRTAVLSHSVSGTADSEGTIEAALLRESDPRLLFRGWSLLASVFERRAQAATTAAASPGPGGGPPHASVTSACPPRGARLRVASDCCFTSFARRFSSAPRARSETPPARRGTRASGLMPSRCRWRRRRRCAERRRSRGRRVSETRGSGRRRRRDSAPRTSPKRPAAWIPRSRLRCAARSARRAPRRETRTRL